MSSGLRATAVVIVIGLALELAGMAAYVLVARHRPSSGEGFLLASLALAMTVLLAFSIRRLSWARRALVVFVLSIGLLGVVELLAWTVFPGPSHDLVPFSTPHVWRMMAVATLGVVVIGSLMLVLSILTIDSVLGPSESSED